MKTDGNTLNADGRSCGLRLGISAGKNLFQTSLLYTRVHIPVVSTPKDENAINNALPTKSGLGVQMLARHHFNPHKKVFTFLAAGASAVVFNRNIQYHSAAGPVFPGESQTNRFDLAAVFSPGIRCKIDEKMSLDLETGVHYYFLENTFYKHNLAYTIGFTFNYRLNKRDIASSEQ